VGKYFLLFSSPNDFKLGENAGFSLVLSLVEYYNEDLLIEHPLLGESEEEMVEKRVDAAYKKSTLRVGRKMAF
jgi:hypothetical protein